MSNDITPFGPDRPVADVPAYAISEAAKYLRMSPSTLSSWLRGRTYKDKVGARREWERVIEPAEFSGPRLSFRNLLEAHVLRSMRYHHNVQFRRIYPALEFVRREYGSEHPLLAKRFMTNGVDLFLEHLGDVVNASKDGRPTLRDIVMDSLKRIEWNADQTEIRRVFPYTRFLVNREVDPEAPRIIAIDPAVAFGRPVIGGTGLLSSVVADRFVAGESAAEIAEDYGLTVDQVEEAIRWEQRDVA